MISSRSSSFSSRIRQLPSGSRSVETTARTFGQPSAHDAGISFRPNTNAHAFRSFFSMQRKAQTCISLIQRDASISVHRMGTSSTRRQLAHRFVAQRFKSNHAETKASKPTFTKSTPPTNEATTTTTLSHVTDLVTDIFPFMGTFLWRLALAYGFVYIFWEYGVEITITEGPSMQHTLQGHGDEIVLMDRFTPARLGLQGGSSSGGQRAQLARQRQREFVAKQQQHPSKPQIWHEPKIPANLLPSKDVWTRFWHNFWTPISVGDVVVLQHPDRAGTVCKRILGLPGDVVTKPISKRGAAKLEWSGEVPNVNKEHSTASQSSTLLPYQANIASLKRQRSASTFTIPDGHLWVEGDNPWNSNDSRNYGAIPASLIVGRVVCRIWPIKGHAVIERGDRPIHHPHDNDATRPSLAFSGSIVFPAGYHDQIIIRDPKQWQQIIQQNGVSQISTTTVKPIDNATSLAATAAEPKE